MSKAATVVAALPTLTRMRISSPAEWLRRHPRVRAALGFEDTIWTRKVTDDEIGRIIARLDPPRVSVLEISGARCGTFAYQSYRRLDFPEFDISTDVLPERFSLTAAGDPLTGARLRSGDPLTAVSVVTPGNKNVA